ncbi:DUF2461 domain-containing protein [Undibacterium arcticum]|uniref:DUF2461 domain-containing protein n=1 Tax=Undibacterium arcticum TaxID=1762892 RepID=A0ABV7F669_9BURK
MHIRDLTRFLAELAENNNRPWFVMNQPRYDILRAEFLTLVTRLIDDLGRFDPAVVDCNPKKALFRINRDMRFAHDKRPYKTTFSASIVPLGRKKPSEGGGPAYYFHIDAAGKLLLAAGEYMPPADRLRAIRNHIVADAAGFTKLMNTRKLRAGFDGLLQEGKLSRPPKGFDPDAPHIDYLKLKSFIVVREHSLTEQIPDDLGAELALGFKAAYPFVSWLRGAT